MAQVQAYFWVTGIREGFILFDCKNNQEYHDYALTSHDELIGLEIARITRREPFRAELSVPPCSCEEEGHRDTLCLHRPDAALGLEELKTLNKEEF